MAAKSSLSSVFDLIPDTLDKVLKLLSGVGIDLPPLMVQAFVLVMDLVLLYALLRQVRKKSKNLPLLMCTVALALIAAGILYSWTEQWLYPPPGEISGSIEPIDSIERRLFPKMRLILLDFRGQKISTDFGIVDTTNGQFALTYKAGFGIRPRTIKLTTSGCKDLEHTIGRNELREGNVSISFKCGEPR